MQKRMMMIMDAVIRVNTSKNMRVVNVVVVQGILSHGGNI